MGVETTLSTYDAESVEYRGYDLTSDLMETLDFGGCFYLLVSGQKPTDGESRVMNAMLSTLMAHGLTPHAVATRLTLLSAPESVQGAVASGMLGTGSQYLGAMEQTARQLISVSDDDRDPDTVEELVTEFIDDGEPFPGIGHPIHRGGDPRAMKLFEIARDADVVGEHVDLLHDIQQEFNQRNGTDLPINVTGAIAALTADMGLSPTAAKGVAIISRSAGLVAEVNEEQENPMAMDIVRLIDNEITYDPSH